MIQTPNLQTRAIDSQLSGSRVVGFLSPFAAMIRSQLSIPVFLLGYCSPAAASLVLSPDEDVMTSGFFQGADLVRGYAGNNRPVLRVSNDAPFATAGAETIYLSFESFDPGLFSDPVSSAILTVTSVDGGFSANGSAETPFVVSAHGVDADPFATILDDTNPGGTTDWVQFYQLNILQPVGSAPVQSFGLIEIDVTSLVNGWIAGDIAEFTIALTGKNYFGGEDILHGFSNNSEAPGSTFLTLHTIPEPSAAMLALLGTMAGLGRRVR